MKPLIEGGACFNASNVHGESVVEFVINEEVPKCDNDANLKMADARDRTPLMTLFSNKTAHQEVFPI